MLGAAADRRRLRAGRAEEREDDERGSQQRGFERCAHGTLLRMTGPARTRSQQSNADRARVQIRAVLRSGFAFRRDDGHHRALPPCGPVAQLAEQQTLNLRVLGSIPSWLTIIISR